ncbi:MAG: SOS response-associated peptidase [Desulfobulbaceae bacterium]|nr:SOS response-associated peptidase [Desulfobulbaceae bacterium]
MCGRFAFTIPAEVLAETFGVSVPPVLEHRYNIAPTQQVFIVRDDADGRNLSNARWGLIPHWAKDISIGSKMINARAETVHEKPAFRQAIKARRCIVPAGGFFEWLARPNGKIPYYITMKDGSPLPMAGIWESWRSPEGAIVESCSILTTTANELMTPIHHRMPVILRSEEFDFWLDRTVTDPIKLKRLFPPYPAVLMASWPVSRLVNSPAHDSSDCIKPEPS